MLVERSYPLSKELLQRMLDLGLVVEEENTAELPLAILGKTATGKESSNPFMADSNNVDEESQKIGRQAQVMISDAEEYLILEDPVKQGRIEETENA
ncbi:hypothetical protein Tco_1118788 [Tanacetum coccineum]